MGVRWRERVGCEDESLASMVVLSIPGRPPPPPSPGPLPLFLWDNTPQLRSNHDAHADSPAWWW